MSILMFIREISLSDISISKTMLWRRVAPKATHNCGDPPGTNDRFEGRTILNPRDSVLKTNGSCANPSALPGNT